MERNQKSMTKGMWKIQKLVEIKNTLFNNRQNKKTLRKYRKLCEKNGKKNTTFQNLGGAVKAVLRKRHIDPLSGLSPNSGNFLPYTHRSVVSQNSPFCKSPEFSLGEAPFSPVFLSTNCGHLGLPLFLILQCSVTSPPPRSKQVPLPWTTAWKLSLGNQ